MNKYNVLGAYLSWVMDSYDLGAVIITSTIIGNLFFPNLGFLGSVLPIMFTVISRPLGGFLLGYLTDLKGRKMTLLLTVIGYSASIGVTGLLPTYAQIGIIAPISIIALRILQGLFIGGDVASSFALAMESIERRRGLYSGLMQSGVLVGFVIVDYFFSYLTLQDWFIQFGWRLIFLLGMIPALLAVLIRIKVSDPEVFQKLGRSRRPLAGLKPFYQTILVTIGFWIISYSGPTFIPTVLGQFLHLKPQEYGFLVLYMNVIGIPSMIISGLLSDFIGRKVIGILGLVLASLGGILFYTKLIFSQPLLTPVLLFGFLVNLPQAITPAYLAERFKTASRGLGIGFSYNGGFIIAGFTQLIISILSNFIPLLMASAIILTLGSLISATGLLLGPETLKVNSLDEELKRI